jgi:hypothetical protein
VVTGSGKNTARNTPRNFAPKSIEFSISKLLKIKVGRKPINVSLTMQLALSNLSAIVISTLWSFKQ